MQYIESGSFDLLGFACHLDNDLKVTWVSRDLYADGSDRPLEIIGRHCYEVLSRRGKPCDNCPVMKVIETGIPRVARSANPDGNAIFCKAWPIRNNGGDTTGAVLVVDNTEETGPNASGSTGIESLDCIPIDNYPYAVVILDPETMVPVRVNQAAMDLLGYTADEITKIPLWDIDKSNTREETRLILGKIIEEGQGLKEAIIRTKNGELKDCLFTGSSMGLPDRELVFAVIQDITDRKKAEQVLYESESLFRSLVENSPDIILEINLEGTILYSNRVLKGTRKEEAHGSNLLSFMPRSHHRKIRQQLHRSHTRRRNTSYEVSVVTPAGTRWWSVRVIPLETEGRINRFLLIITDVTESKRAQESLRLSEERYRSLTENSPLPMFVCADEVIRYLNPMGITLMGADNEEQLLDRTLMDFIHPDDRKKARSSLSNHGNNGSRQAIKDEYRIKRLDGEILTVVTSAITVSFEGEMCQLLIMNDITDRIKAEEALRASERKYRYLTENMRDAVWMMDLNWKHIYVSPSIEKIRGFTPKEILELPIEQSLTPESLENAYTMLSEAIQKGGLNDNGEPIIEEFEQVEYCRDGSTVWTEVQASTVLDDDGKPIGMMGITRDITERKEAENALRQSEEQYRYLVEHSPIPILIHRNGELVYLNSRALSYLDVPSFAEIKGKSVLEFLHPDDISPIRERLEKSQDGVIKPRNFTYRIMLPNGSSKAFQATSMDAIFGGEECRMVVAHEIIADDDKPETE